MDTATHLLYVLLDSNLPTGGFVSSSGLESYAKHGFLRIPGWDVAPLTSAPASVRPASAPPLGQKAGAAITAFTEAEVGNFESTTGWYLREGWRITRAAGQEGVGGDAAGDGGGDGAGDRGKVAGGDGGVTSAVEKLVALDQAHEATLLSHVGRRASKAQGIAMLTLHARSFGDGNLVKAYKRAVVRKDAPGHLAVAFGVVTAAMGIELDTARHLYLFTHVRSTLSAGVRLNVVGPYLSTQLLAGEMRGVLGGVVEEARRREGEGDEDEDEYEEEDGDWAWAKEAEKGPATTWPLGEILAARHDMQHSRIFNS